VSERRPLVIVIHGPAGVGKDSIIDELRERTNIRRATSSTTRAPRTGERPGIDYHFLTRAEFQHGIDEGRFVEWAQVYDDLKGVHADEVEGPIAKGQDLIIRTDVQGARTWRKKLAGGVFIFLMPGTEHTPDVPARESIARLVRTPAVLDEVRDLLRARLTARGSESVDSLERRLAEIDEEIKDIPNNDYVVYNRQDELARAVSDVEAIMAYERENAARPAPRLRP
jgi:guanylate kinase